MVVLGNCDNNCFAFKYNITLKFLSPKQSEGILNTLGIGGKRFGNVTLEERNEMREKFKSMADEEKEEFKVQREADKNRSNEMRIFKSK